MAKKKAIVELENAMLLNAFKEMKAETEKHYKETPELKELVDGLGMFATALMKLNNKR